MSNHTPPQPPTPPADYDERVRRCITLLENVRHSRTFEGKVLVEPGLLDECYWCLNEYLVGAPTPGYPMDTP